MVGNSNQLSDSAYYQLCLSTYEPHHFDLVQVLGIGKWVLHGKGSMSSGSGA